MTKYWTNNSAIWSHWSRRCTIEVNVRNICTNSENKIALLFKLYLMGHFSKFRCIIFRKLRFLRIHELNRLRIKLLILKCIQNITDFQIEYMPLPGMKATSEYIIPSLIVWVDFKNQNFCISKLAKVLKKDLLWLLCKIADLKYPLFRLPR